MLHYLEFEDASDINNNKKRKIKQHICIVVTCGKLKLGHKQKEKTEIQELESQFVSVFALSFQYYYSYSTFFYLLQQPGPRAPKIYNK